MLAGSAVTPLRPGGRVERSKLDEADEGVLVWQGEGTAGARSPW